MVSLGCSILGLGDYSPNAPRFARVEHSRSSGFFPQVCCVAAWADKMSPLLVQDSAMNATPYGPVTLDGRYAGKGRRPARAFFRIRPHPGSSESGRSNGSRPWPPRPHFKEIAAFSPATVAELDALVAQFQSRAGWPGEGHRGHHQSRCQGPGILDQGPETRTNAEVVKVSNSSTSPAPRKISTTCPTR